MTAIKERGETPFEEAGEGVVLSFSNADLKKLQAECGKKVCVEAQERLNDHDMDLLDAMLKHGAKKDGKPFKVTVSDLDNVPVSEVSIKVLDALYVSLHGETFQAHIERINEAFAAMREAGEEFPSLMSPEMPSTN